MKRSCIEDLGSLIPANRIQSQDHRTDRQGLPRLHPRKDENRQPAEPRPPDHPGRDLTALPISIILLRYSEWIVVPKSGE